MWRSTLFVALLFVAAAAGGRMAAAQQAITVISEAPRNEFPVGVTFAISFQSPAPPKDVRLRYELAPDGTGATAVAQCSGGATSSCTFTLASGRGIFVIPGAEITYRWDIEDEDGNKLSTQERKYVHTDTRFDFRTVNDGNMTVYFAESTENTAGSVLQAAVETMASIGALEKTQVDFPVKVFLYRTATEMQPAIAPGGGRGVQILGEVVYSDTAMVSADTATLDIARHEVAHIVTREATRGPFGIPNWMNEGISVYSQRQPLSGHDAALQSAIRRDRVLSMAELNSSSTGDVQQTVSLFYGQAGSMIKFMVDNWGPEMFAQLLSVFKAGSTPDAAFERVYRVNELGLENAWRESVGLPARTAAPTPTPGSTEEARAEPTRVASGGDGESTNTGDDDGGSGIMALVVIVALGMGVLVTAAAALAFLRSRL